MWKTEQPFRRSLSPTKKCQPQISPRECTPYPETWQGLFSNHLVYLQNFDYFLLWVVNLCISSEEMTFFGASARMPERLMVLHIKRAEIPQIQFLFLPITSFT